MRPLRVLHVIAGLAPRYGGPPQVCLELCEELARRGHQVSIFTTNVDGPEELAVPLDTPVRLRGVETFYFPVGAPRAFATSWPMARALKRAIPEQDLVHIHALYLFPSTVAAHYARRYRVPYVVQPHGVLDPYLFRRHRGRKWVYERLIEWRNLNRAAAIFFTTPEERDLTRPLALRAPGVVVPLGVYPEQYADDGSPDTFRAAHPETRGRRLVLFLGRLNFKKGLDLLVEAFARLARQRDDIRLIVAGPDEDGYGRLVRSWLETAGVADRASFTGMLVGPMKLAAFREAELFVLPSYSENFGVAVIEAMACGRPVVISNRVNLWRDVVAANAGLVVDCDAGEVATAIQTLLDDPSRARAMGERGRRLVVERLSWTVVTDRLTEIYRTLIPTAEPTGNGRREPQEAP